MPARRRERRGVPNCRQLRCGRPRCEV